MVDTVRRAVLEFDVRGEGNLQRAIQELSQFQARIGQMARDTQAVSGIGGSTQQSQGLYRGVFAENEKALRSFDAALQQTKTNTKQATTSMVAEFQKLEREIAEYKALADRAFKAGDFQSGQRPVYTNPALPGSIQRVPGEGFYPVSQAGQRLTETPFHYRPQAAEVVQQHALQQMLANMEQTLSRVLGYASGLEGTPAAATGTTTAVGRETVQLTAAQQQLRGVVEQMAQAGRRVTDVWESNGRTMVRWEQDVAGRVSRGVASYSPQDLQTLLGGAGGVPPRSPRSGLAGAFPSGGGGDPVIRDELRRGITAFIRSAINPETGVITDLQAQSNLGQRYAGEPYGPDALAAQGAKQYDAERAGFTAQAKAEVADMMRQVNDVIRQTGQGYAQTIQQVYEQREPGYRQQPVELQSAIGRELQKLAPAGEALTRAGDALGRAARREIALDNQAATSTGFQKYSAEFQQGFYGRREIPFAEQIGQVAKFSLLYGAAYQVLFSFQQGMQAAVQETIQYNAAVIELSIATGRQTSEIGDFAADLGKASTAFGLSPAEGVRTGAAAVGIFGLQDAPFDLATAQTTAFTEAVGQVAFVTGRTAEQVTQDLGAISQAFDLNASQSRLAQDLDAFFSKRFGSPAGGTLETVAQIGSLGKEAGFNQAEVTALASLIQSRTGQTPAATAGFLSQFFGRAGDPALKQTFSELGIDVAQPFRDQIQELSKIMRRDELGEGLRLEIINAFGRGRSGQTAAIIAESFPEVDRGARAAEEKAAGAGQQQLEERLKSVGGLLAQLGGELKELAIQVGQSGLLDAFAALVFILKESVQALNTVLGVFNELPRPVKDAIVALGLLALASRSAAVRGVVSGAVDSARLGAAYGGFGGLGTGGGVRGFLGAAAPSLAIGGAIAGLLALASLREQSINLDKAMNAAGLSLTAIGEAQTPDELRAAAQSVRSEAESVREAPGLLIRAATLGEASREADEMADHLERSADLADRIADAEERRLAADAKRLSVGVFQNPAVVDDVVTGLQQLDSSGAGTVQSVNLLSRAIDSLGRESSTARSRLRQFPGEFTKIFSQALQKEDLIKDLDKVELRDTPALLAAQARDRAAAEADPNVAVGQFAGDYALSRILSGDADSGEFLAQLTSPEAGGVDVEGLQARVSEYVKEKGRLTGSTVNQLINQEMQNFTIDEVDGKELSEQGQVALRQRVKEYLKSQLEGLGRNIDPNRALSGAEAKSYLDQAITPTFDARAAALTAQGSSEGSDAQVQLARQRVNAIRNLQVVRSARQPGSYYSEQLRAAEVAFAQQQLARSQALREAAQDQAKGDAEVRRIGRRFFRRDFQTALRSGSTDLLKQVIANANQHQIDLMKAEIRESIEVTKTKLVGDAAAASIIDGTTQLIDGSINLVAKSNALVQKKLANLREAYRRLANVGRTTVSTNQYNSPDALDTSAADAGPTDTAAQIAAAQQAAEAARTDDAVAAARAQVAAAAADLAAAEPGTVEYYSALQAYYEAQRSLADTILEVSAAAKLAEAARTDDAVAQARANLQIAAAQLASETAGTLAYYEALQAYREAQLALEDTIVEEQNARNSARASARGSAVVTATADLENARNALRNETEGTLAYYQALQQFNEAKRALSEAIREQKYVQDQLAGDITDPVDQARAELRRARRQLRYDQRNNSGRDAIQSSKLDVQQQEAALQQTKFEQWLGDLQTNEQLDRIGHAQYVRTLERRIQRLRDIRNRTRQEQDQLNQLLQVLQEAQKALSGQFNIGAIDLPTPYEARRYIEERKAQIDRQLEGPGGAGGTPSFSQISAESRPNQTLNHFDIDGADTGLIKRLLVELLGRQAIGTTTTNPGKR